LSRLLGVFAGASAVVLLAGWLLAETGDAIAEQTGLGATFVGVTLLALATSLPEISTTTAAARNGNYESAFGNIFGSNAFNIALLVLVAALAGGTATLAAMSASTRFAAALAILLTTIYLWGLLEREDRTVLRMGWDSAAVTVLAVAGFAVMYWLG
jgi:cation:H+ antiporter